MKGVLGFECRRCFGGKKFLCSLLALGTLSFLHVGLSVVPLVKWLPDWQGDLFLTPHSAYAHWIGVDYATVWPTLLYLLLPLLVVFPFGDTAFWDFDSVYCQQIFIRTKRGPYFFAKFLTLFCTGFVLTALTLCTDFALTAFFLPLVRPEVVTKFYSITDHSLFSTMFYTKPFLYTVLYGLLDAVLVGAWACLALFFACVTKSRLQTVLLPFLCHLLIYFLFDWMGLNSLAFFAILLPFQPAKDVSLFVLLFYGLVVPAVSFGVYNAKKREQDIL